MENYKRGDILKRKEDLNRKEIINRGEAMQGLVDTDGWKYLSKWANEYKEQSEKLLLRLDVIDLNRIMDMRVMIKSIEQFINKPKEWIELAQREIKKKE